MIEDYIQYDFNPGFMQGPDHRLKIVDMTPLTDVGGVPGFPSIKVDTKSVDIATTAAATARSEDISFGEALQRAHPVKFTETNVISTIFT